MAIQQALMAFGAQSFLATSIVGDVADSLTAAGSTQGTALKLNSAINIVTTTAASTGVQLPPLNPGDSVTVVNLGANSLSVYPLTGGTIQTGAANAAFAVATGKSATFIARGNPLNAAAILSA